MKAHRLPNGNLSLELTPDEALGLAGFLVDHADSFMHSMHVAPELRAQLPEAIERLKALVAQDRS